MERSSLLHRDLHGHKVHRTAFRAPQDDKLQWSVELRSADCSQRRMARVCHLLHDPVVLADGSSSCAQVAHSRGFAIPGPGAGVADDVDRRRSTDGPLAQTGDLLHLLDVDSRGSAVCHRHLHLCAFWSPLQPGSVGRSSGSPRQPPRRSTDHDGHSRPRAAPGISGPPMRDAGLEPRDGFARLLVVDGACDRDRSGDDSNGRCGVGEEIR